MKHSGTISLDGQPQTDLVATLESGQTFQWDRRDAEMFSGQNNTNPVFSTVRQYNGEPVVVFVSESETGIRWESTRKSGEELVQRALRLDDNLQTITDDLTSKDTSGVLIEALTEFAGLRVPHDPLFSTIISFICSPQMRVSRIHGMVQRLAQSYGTPVEADEETFYLFPTPEQLAEATEDDLRELKLGYRAPYVQRTASAIANGDIDITNLPSETDEIRTRLKQCTGVGDKVADCILLYGAGNAGTVPVDTWIQTAVEEHYPSLMGESPRATAQNLEELFGSYAGYAQTYLFHYHRKHYGNA